MNFNLFDDMDDRVIYNRILRPDDENSNIPEMREDFEKMVDNSNISEFPAQTPLAMAYVPFQQWGSVYDSNEGFHKGTIFPDLDFPFMRGGGKGE